MILIVKDNYHDPVFFKFLVNLSDIDVENQTQLTSSPTVIRRSQDFNFRRSDIRSVIRSVDGSGEIFPNQIFEISGEQKLLLKNPVHSSIVKDLKIKVVQK